MDDPPRAGLIARFGDIRRVRDAGQKTVVGQDRGEDVLGGDEVEHVTDGARNECLARYRNVVRILGGISSGGSSQISS